MNYTAKDIFNSASSFDWASVAVIEKSDQTNDVGTFMAPFVTLSAFSIELYLKCIYTIEYGKDAPYQHDLDKLFSKLTDESRVVIRMFYDMFVEKDVVVNAMLVQVPEAKIDLDSVLKESGKAFEKWRYSYQRNITGFPASRPLIQALRARIQILKPEWF